MDKTGFVKPGAINLYGCKGFWIARVLINEALLHFQKIHAKILQQF